MKKLLFVTFIFINFILSGQDFRQVKWGMSKEDVKKTETAETIDVDNTNDSLKYKTKLNDFDFYITYTFNKNKLMYGIYGFKYETVTLPVYKESKEFFYKFKDLLSKKYGDYKIPTISNDLIIMTNGKEIFNNINYNLEEFLQPDEYAIKSQLLIESENEYINKIIKNGFHYAIKWETSTTIILLVVENDIRAIYYMEKDYYNKLNSKIQKTINDNIEKSTEGL